MEILFHDGPIEIVLKATMLGKEEVYVNGEQVSSKRNLGMKGSHTFTANRDGRMANYRLEIKAGLRKNTFALFRDDALLEEQSYGHNEILELNKMDQAASDHDEEESNEGSTRQAGKQKQAKVDEDSPASNIFWGVVLVAAAIGLFFYFQSLENSPARTVRMNAIIALIYKMGGKWTVLVVFGALGAFMLSLGFGQLKRRNVRAADQSHDDSNPYAASETNDEKTIDQR